jgi:hypothetical protein
VIPVFIPMMLGGRGYVDPRLCPHCGKVMPDQGGFVRWWKHSVSAIFVQMSLAVSGFMYGSLTFMVWATGVYDGPPITLAQFIVHQYLWVTHTATRLF